MHIKTYSVCPNFYMKVETEYWHHNSHHSAVKLWCLSYEEAYKSEGICDYTQYVLSKHFHPFSLILSFRFLLTSIILISRMPTSNKSNAFFWEAFPINSIFLHCHIVAHFIQQLEHFSSQIESKSLLISFSLS